jgi:YHS domain-containing protein
MAKDPVCEIEVDDREAEWKGLSSERDGTYYFFCSPTCKDEFDLDPEQYITRLEQMRASDDGMGGFPSTAE